MMKMLKRSAEILDDVDALLAKMRWIEFKQEQDMRLWAPLDDEESWYPGENLYEYNTGTSHGFMAALKPIGQFNLGSYPTLRIANQPVTVPEYNEVNTYELNYCHECGVWWETDENCWVCGVTKPQTLDFGGVPEAVQVFLDDASDWVSVLTNSEGISINFIEVDDNEN